MYCKHCGKQIADDARFCDGCGERISDAPVLEVKVESDHNKSSRPCPKCGHHNVQYQTVTESRGTGCMTILFYVILALTVFGLLIVIPLMLRKKTETVTYAVCQNCGHKWQI